ncbi:MAG: hypothetical protein D3903_19655 [Candidatus Electrothrix sp. GM3_4]|nr:hypothetical protein [Candidatus Electrothrix sp. GM3_4]
MPAEAVLGLFGIIVRFIFHIIIEVVIETAIRALGYGFFRLFGEKVDFDCGRVLFFGVIGWVIILAIYYFFIHDQILLFLS